MPAPDIWRIENDDLTELYNFLDNANLGIEEYTDSATEDGNKIVETFYLSKKDVDPASIRADINQLEGMLQNAIRWHQDKHRRDPHWYRWVTSGEDAKRALIYSYILRNAPHEIIDRNFQGDAGYLQLALTRHRAFEEVTPSTASITNLSLFGGVWNIGISGGVLNGRINKLRFKPSAGGVGNSASQIWCGIRPVRHGVSTFNPVLDVGSESESGAYNGTVAKAEEGSETSGYAVNGLYGNGSINLDDYEGRYLVLCRYRYTDTTTRHAVWLDVGIGTGNTTHRFERQYPPNYDTKFHLFPLGELEITPTRLSSDIVSNYPREHISIRLFRSRVEGSGAIYIDALCLVPIEHFIGVGSYAGSSSLLISNYSPAHIYTNPDDTIDAFEVSEVSVGNERLGQIMNPSDINWQYPREGGVLVCFTDLYGVADAHPTTVQGDFEIEVYKRWPTYRD